MPILKTLFKERLITHELFFILKKNVTYWYSVM